MACREEELVQQLELKQQQEEVEGWWAKTSMKNMETLGKWSCWRWYYR
jgi:hypothetical protein